MAVNNRTHDPIPRGPQWWKRRPVRAFVDGTRAKTLWSACSPYMVRATGKQWVGIVVAAGFALVLE